MSKTLGLAALGAVLLAGTTAANAQAVIVTDPYPPAVTYEAPPVVVAPAPRIIVAPAPVTEEDEIIAAPPAVATETTVVRPAPERRIVRHHPRSTHVRLTTRQRREVLRTIRYERPAPRVTEAVSYSVGSVLPATVPLYALPQQVVYDTPALRGYDYTLVGDRVLLVEPGTHTVIDEID
jgi:hypothetical protein